jgi:hypothetical protein
VRSPLDKTLRSSIHFKELTIGHAVFQSTCELKAPIYPISKANNLPSLGMRLPLEDKAFKTTIQPHVPMKEGRIEQMWDFPSKDKLRLRQSSFQTASSLLIPSSVSRPCKQL